MAVCIVITTFGNLLVIVSFAVVDQLTNQKVLEYQLANQVKL